ncbi:MAG: YncE family protein [Janthinobacterium lividum]
MNSQRCDFPLGHLPLCWGIAVFLASLFLPSAAFAQAASSQSVSGTGIPVTFHLEKPGCVTLVAEDAQTGRRVANLLAETPLPAGDHRVVWDGFDAGMEVRGRGWVRRRVMPGTYRLRGLVHDSLHLRYEFPVYSPGTPPWKTPDGAGAWLADHSSPSAVLYLPPHSGSPYGKANVGQMLLSANVAESGYALLWTDLSGHPLHGAKINGWMGGKALARDAGPRRDPACYAYTAFVTNADGGVTGDAGKNGIIQVYGLTADPQNPFVKIWEHAPGKPLPFDGYHNPLSISVFNGGAAVSSSLDDRVYFVDVKAKQQIGSAALPSPRGVAWDARGRLYAVTQGTVILCGRPDPAAGTLGPQTLVVPGALLDTPRQILVDGAGGRLFVSQWGRSHQVKMFALATGRSSGLLGHSGGPQIGHYDDHRMHYPNGMALVLSPSGSSVLWVMEDDFLPKRVSVWSLRDASLVNAFYGPNQYGGGGTLDPGDPHRLFYASTFNFGSKGGMIFSLDWKTGRAVLTDIYARGPEPQGESATITKPTDYHMFQPYDPLPESDIPERPVHIHGQTYLVNTYNGVYRANSAAAIWKLDDKTGIAWPVAYVGGGSSWFQRFFDGSQDEARTTANKAAGQHILDEIHRLGGDWSDAFVTWSDLNGNHRTDPDEWTVRVFPHDQTAFRAPDGQEDRAHYFGGWSLSTSDLSYTGGWAVRVPAPTFTASGVPVYDISKAQITLPPRPEFRSPIDGDTALRFDSAPGGWLLQLPSYGWQNGVLRWTYPISDIRLPPARPGDMEAVDRLMGPLITPRLGEAGPTAFFDNDKGAIYLMTADGLFLQTLGGDDRLMPLLHLPSAPRGLLVDGHSFGDEHWHTDVTQYADGQIYLTAGHEFIGIFHVEGLDSVRRLDFGTVTVTPEEVAALPEEQVNTPINSVGSLRKTLTVAASLPAVTVDGDLSDWPQSTQWAEIGTGRARAAVAISGGRLCAAWHTSDPNLLDNAGGQASYLFKSGGALDIMLAAQAGADRQSFAPQEGDERLLITRNDGKVRAVLYRPVMPGAASTEQAVFASPVGRIVFDSVTDVSDQVHLAQKGSDYEVSVPISLLGLTAGSVAPGRTLLGDIGFLRGQGGQTIERAYWSNPDTSLVSDVPTEARLQPGNWGLWTFR